MHADFAYRLYQLLLKSYQTSSSHLYRRLIEGSIRIVAVRQMRRQGMRFPERAAPGWWWTWRWRFEVLMRWTERESVKLCRTLIRPGMTVVDIGAHIGYYTRLLSELVGPSGNVFAFEPEPVNHAVLVANLAAKKYGNVVVSTSAVSDRIGAATLHLSPGSSNHSLLSGYTETEGTTEVTTVTLDSFLSDRGIENVDFVKIDVEGAEPLVLAGMTNTISRSPRVSMLVECNPQALACAGASANDLLDNLRQMHFAVRKVPPDIKSALDDTVNLWCSKV
jgi:FkbM family methyltransferase